jgi:hypothetical protein
VSLAHFVAAHSLHSATGWTRMQRRSKSHTTQQPSFVPQTAARKNDASAFPIHPERAAHGCAKQKGADRRRVTRERYCTPETAHPSSLRVRLLAGSRARSFFARSPARACCGTVSDSLYWEPTILSLAAVVYACNVCIYIFRFLRNSRELLLFPMRAYFLSAGASLFVGSLVVSPVAPS